MRGLGFPKVPVPFYNGTAWLLPFAGAYYKAAASRERGSHGGRIPGRPTAMKERWACQSCA